MTVSGFQSDLVLVQGLYFSDQARTEEINNIGPAMGVDAYELVDGSARAMANRFLRKMRKTAPPVDRVEIFLLNEKGLRDSLATDEGARLWRQRFGCESRGYDVSRSFVLMGRPLHLLQGEPVGQRLLWFGNGLDHLSREGFIQHYTGQHGPLVASHAELIGLRDYHQVPGEREDLCEALREQGLGKGTSPAVFAQLTMGPPSFKLSSFRQRRVANREIKADEQRHISFQRSMLLLSAN